MSSPGQRHGCGGMEEMAATYLDCLLDGATLSFSTLARRLRAHASEPVLLAVEHADRLAKLGGRHVRGESQPVGFTFEFLPVGSPDWLRGLRTYRR